MGMPPGVFAALLGLAVLVTLGSAYYLLLNARSVAGLFARADNELAPGPGRSRAPRGRVMLALALFTAGSIACLGLWWFTLSDVAPRAVDSRPGEVQRP
jgi:hypothetical protein